MIASAEAFLYAASAVRKRRDDDIWRVTVDPWSDLRMDTLLLDLVVEAESVHTLVVRDARTSGQVVKVTGAERRPRYACRPC